MREWESWSPAPDAPWEAPPREPEAIALRAAEESLLAVDAAELAENEQYRTGETDGPAEAESVETFGGDEVEEVEEADAARRRAQPTRHYKIQEVVKRRQIMLVQVAKEERGNKGAALTTYLSLAGRYCVLMPNTGRGGGVSRKINSIADRRRLKDILEDLDIPEGMGVIVRTAGAERSKAEIKRDYEYLLRLWNEIRDLTLKSTAPALIYEEGNLIKRSIRDLYTRDIDEVLVEGEEGYKTAKAFMRTLMPSHAKRVQPYRDPQVALFHRFQIESQIDAIHSPVAQLRSGGYIVINQTEALVAIDVNSGRSTRERNIEETALRTNLEAADEIARQLRLRDLAGLIVIDFIDMEEHRNHGAVERRLKEALKNDRARIQVGRISPFGLLEMSRQRLRPSLGRGLDPALPALRRHRPHSLGRIDGALRAAVDRGGGHPPPRGRDLRLCADQRGALHPQPETRVADPDRGPLRRPGHGRAGRFADPAELPPGAAARLWRGRSAAAAGDPGANPGRGGGRGGGRRDCGGGERGGSREAESEEERAAPPSSPAPPPNRGAARGPAGGSEASDRRAGRTAQVGAEVGKPAREAPEGERENEAERPRRRRGRRGGRARPRRDEAAAVALSGAPVAAETVETVAFAEAEPIDLVAEIDAGGAALARRSRDRRAGA